MKKQISVLLALVSSFYFISCQKEVITSSEDHNLLATTTKGNQGSKMNEAGVPFKGSYTTSFVIVQGAPNIIQNVSGTGIASHLGASTFEATAHVTVTRNPPFAVTGTRTITAANGDQLFTTFTGTSTPVVKGMNGADLHETIIGGTGRFSDATGSFTTTARNNFITSTFTADFDGVIKY